MELGKSTSVQPSGMREGSAAVWVNMGRSGAGKTTMAETLNDTKYEPVALLDIDRKSHVLTDRPDKRAIYPCQSWQDLDDKVQALLAERLHRRFNTVIFDGTTAIQQVLSYGKHKLRGLEGMAKQGAYGNSNLDLVDLAQSARLLAESGTHVIFNIWAVIEEDQLTGLKQWAPDLSPTLLNRMLGLFDFVVGTEPNSQPKPYPPVMYWGGSVSRATRAAISPESPLSQVPDKIYKPSWAHLFDSYHGKPFPIEEHKA